MQKYCAEDCKRKNYEQFVQKNCAKNYVNVMEKIGETFKNCSMIIHRIGQFMIFSRNFEKKTLYLQGENRNLDLFYKKRRHHVTSRHGDVVTFWSVTFDTVTKMECLGKMKNFVTNL